MTHSESWNAFIDELRAYVQEHHHFPSKHTRLLSKVKYTRKKINDGSLEDWKKDADYDRLGLEEEYVEYLGNKVDHSKSLLYILLCFPLPILRAFFRFLP